METNKKSDIYSPEFKELAIELARQIGKEKASEELGISVKTIEYWGILFGVHKSLPDDELIFVEIEDSQESYPIERKYNAPKPLKSKNLTSGDASNMSILMTIVNNRRFIAIFTSICLVVSMMAAFGYYYVKRSSASVSALISYGYSDAEKGIDPMGNPLDVNKIRSPYVIDRALSELDLYSKGITVEDVRSCLKISGVVPDDVLERILIIKQIITEKPEKLEDISEIEYHSTQYTVAITPNAKLKSLDTETLITLVNEICKQYQLFFVDEYNNVMLMDTITKDFDQQNYDYFESVQILRGQIANMIRYCGAMNNRAPEFRSPTTNLTFGDIGANLELIKNVDISRISALVYSSTMSRNASRAVTICQFKILQMNSEMETSLSNASNAERLAKEFEKDYWILDHGNSTSSLDVFRQASAVYDTFMTEAFNSGEHASQLKEDIEIHTIFLNNLLAGEWNRSETDVKFVEEQIPLIADSLRYWSDITYETTEDYVRLELFKNAVKTITPAILSNVFDESKKTLMLIIGAGLGLGLFGSAFIVLCREELRSEKRRVVTV